MNPLNFRKLRKLKRIGLYLAAIITLSLVCFPLYWMIISSFRPLSELFKYPPRLFPTTFTLEHYKTLLAETQFITYFVNSTLTAAASVVTALAAATIAAYSLVRYKYRGKYIILTVLLTTYMFAKAIYIIPLFVLFKNLHLTDSLIGLSLAHIGRVLPFGLLLMYGFFVEFPWSLEEQAMVDGASRWQTFFKVVLPLGLPGIIATSLYAFVVTWNDYLYAFILISSPSKRTLPLGISYFFEATAIEWGMMMSALVLITIPAIVLFTVIQRQLIAGFTAGAIKG